MLDKSLGTVPEPAICQRTVITGNGVWHESHTRYECVSRGLARTEPSEKDLKFERAEGRLDQLSNNLSSCGRLESYISLECRPSGGRVDDDTCGYRGVRSRTVHPYERYVGTVHTG